MKGTKDCPAVRTLPHLMIQNFVGCPLSADIVLPCWELELACCILGEAAGMAMAMVLAAAGLNELMEICWHPLCSDDQQDIGGSANALP